MNSSDAWENHIEGLTKQVAFLLRRTQDLEDRLEYYEEVFITLLKALKQSGIIADDENGKHSMPS
jgi:DNA-directed RNA polymerase specialized sigma24 family protein|tara:strand:- start:1235 stop:1429 length:195 start_codon:yes stop_codon:yes gene_type:complete